MFISLVRQWLSLRFFLAGVALIPLGGCGYQWVGQSSLLPKDARTVYVEPFINRSRDIGMEKELTSALRSEFYRRGQLRVVDASEQADIILSGVVRSLETTVASVNRYDEVLQYESVLSSRRDFAPARAQRNSLARPSAALDRTVRQALAPRW